MIGKEGQYLITINNDELDVDEVRRVRVEEDAGLGLPLLFIDFATRDEEKIKRYNRPGYEIKVGMGVDSIEYTSTFRTFNSDMSGSYGGDMWTTQLRAVLGGYEYLTLQRMNHFNTTKDPWNSSQVWENVMARAKLKSVTSTSDDKMLWLQHNNTDRKFLEEVVNHGFWAEDDPCLHGIRRNAEGVYKPVSELLVKKGTIGNTDAADIQANSFSTTQNEGFLSSWAGKKRRVPLHTAEGGQDRLEIGEATPQITPDVGLLDITKTQEINQMNDNVHKNWWKADRQNMQLKASMSATSMECVCYGYHDCFLLDAYETMFLSQHGQGQPPQVPYNGLWLVTKIVSTYEAHTFGMHINLNRETLL